MPQFGEEITLRCDPLTQYADADGNVEPLRCQVKHYEWREGRGWTFGRPVATTYLPVLTTRLWNVGTTTYQVRARLDTGHLTRAASVSVTAATPDSHVKEDSRDEHTLSWPGTHSDTTENSDGDLTLDSGKTTGTYTTPEIDLGALATWRVGVLAEVECENRSIKWSGIPWTDLTGLTWDDMRDTYGSFGYRSWEGQLAQELDWQGNNIYNPTSSWTLESTVYDATGVPGTFKPHEPGEYEGRYLQYRITLNRTTANDLTVTDATTGSPIVVTTSAAHGLLTGNGVNIYGVEGNTAANGDGWKITYLTDTTFSLDGSTGGDAYTTGGVVVKDEYIRVPTCEATWSHPFTDTRGAVPVYNVLNFGAKGDGSTDDIAAINAAMTQAKAGSAIGGVVYFPRGEYIVTTQVKVPNRVWLVGANSFASVITADATFSGSTYVVRLGEGGGIVFNCRLHRIRVNAANVAGIGGVYSNEIQEQSGCFNTDVAGYRTWGINFEASGTAASQCGVEQVTLYGSSSGSTGGVRFDSVAGQAFIKHVTASPSGGTPGTDGILVDGGDVNCEHIHIEKHTDGIHYTAGSTGSIRSVYGHVVAGSIPNLIHLESGCNVTLEDINAAGSDGNILVDDGRSITVTVAQTGYIQYYASHEIKFGPVSLTAGSQTAIVDVALPALAGVADTVAMVNLAQALVAKTLVEPIVMNAGQTAAQRIEINNVNQAVAGNILQIPNLGEDGVGGPAPVRSILVDARITSGGALIWQEARGTRLVDSEIKRDGQTSPFVALSSVDQTGAATVRIPDLGDANTHDLVFDDLTQTFTAAQTFSAKITANGGIDVDNSSALRISDNDASEQFVTIDAAVQTGDATASVPDLGGSSDAIVIKDLTQDLAGKTLTRAQLGSGSATISSGVVAIQNTIMTIAAESGTSDTLDRVTGGKAGEWLIVTPDTGDTITVTHDASSGADGNILTVSGSGADISGREKMMFLGVTNTGGVAWHEIGYT